MFSKKPKEFKFLVSLRRKDGVSLEVNVDAENASVAAHRAVNDFQHIFVIGDVSLVGKL